jgi:tripartite-type tricarboxylate transporter receptor subunit TctC
MRIGRRALPGVAASVALLGHHSRRPAQAQAQPRFPDRPVRLIVPFAAGGNADVMARTMAARLGEHWNTQVVIDNRTGGGGVVAIDTVARAAPDGYTVLFHSSGIVLEPYVRKSVTYDVTRDLVPITRISESALAISVNPTLPIRSIGELIAYARANPGRLNYGSPGHGSVTHLATELFLSQADVRMTHVPYRGSGPALLAVTSNEIQLMVDPLATTRPLAEDGRIRTLAVTTAARWPSWPEMPTVRESGLPNYVMSAWHGFFAPAQTPEPVVRRLNQSIRDVLATPEMQAWAGRLGFQVVTYEPEEFRRFFLSEIDVWKDVVVRAGLQPE